MKHIYFVRHGESQSNANIVGIGADPILSDKGREQAAAIAERCAHLPIQVIISSTMNRARETAEIIQSNIEKPLEMSDLIVERRFPSEFSQVMEKDWSAIRNSIKGYFYTPGFRHSDEENFEDILIRANKALQMFLDRKEENILVVTHGSFLRDLVAVAIFRDVLTPTMRQCLTKGLWTNNTGLTMMRSNEEKTQWTVTTWNDRAHLGE